MTNRRFITEMVIATITSKLNIDVLDSVEDVKRLMGRHALNNAGVFALAQFNSGKMTKDTIVVNGCKSTTEYLSTLFHELAHATGTETHLKRRAVMSVTDYMTDMTLRAAEELLAEEVSYRLLKHFNMLEVENEKKWGTYMNYWAQHLTPQQIEAQLPHIHVAFNLCLMWLRPVEQAMQDMKIAA